MPKPQFSEEEFEEIKTLAHELKEKIEKHFSEDYSEFNIAGIKALRKSLEAKGLVVTIDFNLDVLTTKITADVSLWWPKEVN